MRFLEFNEELLKKLTGYVTIRDWQYIDLYRDYSKMESEGEKKTYSVAILSDKYGISERKVYSLIGEFEKDCTDSAAGLRRTEQR